MRLKRKRRPYIGQKKEISGFSDDILHSREGSVSLIAALGESGDPPWRPQSARASRSAWNGAEAYRRHRGPTDDEARQ